MNFETEARVANLPSKSRRRLAFEHVASDWQELVARDEVDLVSVVTPPSTHMEITLAALDRGAVLCEKPLATLLQEALLS